MAGALQRGGVVIVVKKSKIGLETLRQSKSQA